MSFPGLPKELSDNLTFVANKLDNLKDLVYEESREILSPSLHVPHPVRPAEVVLVNAYIAGLKFTVDKSCALGTFRIPSSYKKDGKLVIRWTKSTDEENALNKRVRFGVEYSSLREGAAISSIVPVLVANDSYTDSATDIRKVMQCEMDFPATPFIGEYVNFRIVAYPSLGQPSLEEVVILSVEFVCTNSYDLIT